MEVSFLALPTSSLPRLHDSAFSLTIFCLALWLPRNEQDEAGVEIQEEGACNLYAVEAASMIQSGL